MLDKMLFPFAPEPSWYNRYWYAPEAEPARCAQPLRCGLGRLGRRIGRLSPAPVEAPVAVPAWVRPGTAQRRALS